MARVRLFCGSNRSVRTSLVDRILVQHWPSARLLVPTRRYARRRLEQLLLEAKLLGAWGEPVQSLTDFAEALLREEGIPVRRVSDFERRLLLERALTKLEPAADLPEIVLHTPGLVSHLLDVIAQLKQAAVEPTDFRARAAQGESRGSLDVLVADAYAAYQDALKTAQRYDIPGVYWEAVLRCQGRKPRILEGIEVLALDAFDDFTPSEFRLIEALEPHVPEVVFGLNYDARPNRQDLYTLPAATARLIQTRFDVAPALVESAPLASHVEYAANHIFWRDPPRFPESGTSRELAPNLKVLPCIDTTHEIEAIGRRVKRLLTTQYVPAEAVAVVFRNIEGVKDAIQTIFREFGIPLRMVRSAALAESAMGTFLVRFLDAARTWARENVIDVLSSPRMRVGNGEDRLPVAILARSAQIITGYDEWTSRLETLAERLRQGVGDDVESLLRRLPDAPEKTDAVLERVRHFKSLADTIPSRGTQRVFAEALDKLLDRFRLDKTPPAELAVDAQEGAVCAGIRALLETLAESDIGDTTDRNAFVELFTQGLREIPVPGVTRAPGVACGDPISLRNLTFDHVFFGGLTEGIVPFPPPMNAIYTDIDRARLRAAGIALEGGQEHGARERLLFQHVLESARNSLTLSWPAMKRDGRESTPSPFLTEVLSLFDGHAAVLEPAPRSDAFLPASAEAASLRDFRNAAYYRERTLRKVFADKFAEIEAGVRIEYDRHSPAPFGIYDGVLSDAELVSVLNAEFGTDHQFSVNQLEIYIDCPFRFFAERVLGVEETEAPEAEFDPRVRGTILHHALESFHRRYIGRGIPEIPAEEAFAAMRQAVEEAFAAHEWKSATAPPGLMQVERRRMQAALDRYLDIERNGQAPPWQPGHFEVTFGRVKGPVLDSLSRPEPFRLETGAHPVLFAGRIDRIDKQGDTARIVDYKSGGIPSAGNIISGRSLQLTVYAWALERFLLPGTTCTEAVFIPVGCSEYREALGKNSPRNVWKQREANAMAAIVQAIHGIRSASFPPIPKEEACRYCGHKRACRYQQTRIERKTSRYNTLADASPGNGRE